MTFVPCHGDGIQMLPRQEMLIAGHMVDNSFHHRKEAMRASDDHRGLRRCFQTEAPHGSPVS